MRILSLVALVLLGNLLFGQDSLKTIKLEEVTVLSTRASEKTPMTHQTVAKEELEKRNLGQDLPILLNFTPSIVTTSDAGAGVGYTGMRIRGSDASRINVTINGIPLNDPESHGVFWVNMPDFSSSLNSVQIQRGVGTSSNGPGAFGATVNLQTNNVSVDPFFETNNSFGSFNTWKSNVIYNTGLLKDRFNFEARLSKITSDGYVDRSAAELKSYYLSGGSFGEKTMIKAVIFGGQEITQQAWYGTPEAVLTQDPQQLDDLVNFGGEYSSQEQLDNLANSDRRFNYYLYDNEIDDYRQDHYQLHIGHSFSDIATFSGALHYTRGRGFFEQFKGDEDVTDFGLTPLTVDGQTVNTSDVIVRRWLDNHFYGGTYSLNLELDDASFTLGGAANQYVGNHFGEINWVQNAPDTDIRDKYYDGEATKNDFNVFLKGNYQVNKLNVFADVQVRTVGYETFGTDNDLETYDVDESYTFFNPKAGLTYTLNTSTDLYASYAIGNREPVRSDFIDADDGETPKHETLKNWEAGIRKRGSTFSYEANFYRMDYDNQLILTGAVNDVGNPIRVNTPKSHRMGIELSGVYQFSEKFSWSANLTLSENKVDQFTEIAFDYGADFTEFNLVENEFESSDISFSPNVIGGSILGYQPISNLRIEFLTKYVGKQYLDNTSNDNRAIDAYLVNDLNLAYNFTIDGLGEIGLSLLINNILDEEYSSNGYTWGYYYGSENLYQQNNYYPQAGRNFLAGLTVRF